jgi:hypothetical protein
MSDSAPAAIVKRSLMAAGLDPCRYGVGSLRRGLVLIAARSGLPDRGIAAQTGHKTLALVREYMRRDNLQQMNRMPSDPLPSGGYGRDVFLATSGGRVIGEHE